MDGTLGFILIFLAGIGLGTFFFGGLWLTVQKGLQSKNASLIFMASLVLRVAVVMLGFYYVAINDWKKILICLLGFMIARFVFTRWAKSNKNLEENLINKQSDEN